MRRGDRRGASDRTEPVGDAYYVGLRKVQWIVAQHDAEGFGGCTNIGECTAACPKEIPLDVISRLNWDLHAALRHGH